MRTREQDREDVVAQPVRRAGKGNWQATAGVILLALVAVLLAALVIQAFVGHSNVRTDWEYRTEYFGDSDFDRRIKDMGKQGWELVFARRAEEKPGAWGYEVILKRPH